MLAHRDIPALMPHLHLPVQSGSNRIPTAMNRSMTATLISGSSTGFARCGPIWRRQDFIVGFPGETDRDFADTLSLVDRVGYASAYSFKYSPRPGTPAAGEDRQVPEDVKSDRLEALQQLLNAQQYAFNRSTLGARMDVLVERAGGRPGQVAGRSPYMQAVNIEGDEDLVGRIVSCTVAEAKQNSIVGSVL